MKKKQAEAFLAADLPRASRLRASRRPANERVRSKSDPKMSRFGKCSAWACLIAGSLAHGQSNNASPVELLRHLMTPQDDLSHAVFDCATGRAAEKRSIAEVQPLIQKGAAAIPAVEDALGVAEVRWETTAQIQSEDMWLPFLYAKLKGPDAYPRLKALYSNRAFTMNLIALSLDESVALAFGFTSWVSVYSGSQLKADHASSLRIGRCDHWLEPRYSLDDLLHGWLADDRPVLEASLAPKAKTALDEMLKNQTWSALRAGLWGKAGRSFGMGYRFEIAGSWSVPETTLAEPAPVTLIPGSPETFNIPTQFYDASGDECGSLSITFTETPLPGARLDPAPGVDGKYLHGASRPLVDSSNLADILKLAAACSAAN